MPPATWRSTPTCSHPFRQTYSASPGLLTRPLRSDSLVRTEHMVEPRPFGDLAQAYCWQACLVASEFDRLELCTVLVDAEAALRMRRRRSEITGSIVSRRRILGLRRSSTQHMFAYVVYWYLDHAYVWIGCLSTSAEWSQAQHRTAAGEWSATQDLCQCTPCLSQMS